MTDSIRFPRTEILRNGVEVTIRHLRADDREKVAAAVKGLDRESVYFRLFSYRNELTERGLDRIMAVNAARDAVLVVTHGKGADEVVVGSGRFVGSGAGNADPSAEVAFMVANGYHGQGIARLLLAHLAGIARDRGLASLTAEVLAENKAMLAVFAKSGLPMQKRREGGVVHVTLSMQPRSS
jgi:GNAT superfamily N-acetyltransferase